MIICISLILYITLYVVLYMYLAAVTNVISYVTFRRNVTLTIPFYIPLHINLKNPKYIFRKNPL